MSSVYATEPATSGRVIFETTHGPLEIQLWCNECPETTRFFLQLCIDGFFDDMLFHRIVPGFLIQTGAMRQSEVASHRNNKVDSNSQQIYDSSRDDRKAYRQAVHADYALERRKYELHSRLRFNHRGQVAMALNLDDDHDRNNGGSASASATAVDSVEDLQPQFFVTLDEAPYLDGKHVLFGTISGPTIFNAIRIGGVEVDDQLNASQPVDLEHAPRVRTVKIVDNPVHVTLRPSTETATVVPWRSAPVHEGNQQHQRKKKKRKGKLDINVLSFGDEMEDGNTRLSQRDTTSRHDAPKVELMVAGQDSATDHTPPETHDMQSTQNQPRLETDNGEQLKQTLKYRPSAESFGKAVKDQSINSPKSEQLAPISKASHLDSTDAKVAKSAVEARRAKYTKGRLGKRQREEDTMNKLLSFQSKVKEQVLGSRKAAMEGLEDSLASRMARRAAQVEDADDANDQTPSYHGQVLEDDGEDRDIDGSWLATRFKCRRHMDQKSKDGKELAGDGRAVDDYEVIDEKVNGHHSGDHNTRKSHSRRRHRRETEREKRR
jgi:peptidyl-prolyl cis-trans isomerase SDCCAG10